MLLVGCGGVKDATPPDGESAFQGPPPASSAMIAEGDTAAVLSLLKLTMVEIDAALDSMERRDSVLPAEPGQEARTVSIWLRDGTPRKLLVTEPNEAGAMTLESEYWFVNGEVRAVQQPTAAFFFEADRILLWTDEGLEPITTITPEERMARELEILAEIEKRLAAFGITLS